jgi:hypothetical protein
MLSVSTNPFLLTSECLNQPLWNSVCISCHLRPSQRRTSYISPINLCVCVSLLSLLGNGTVNKFSRQRIHATLGRPHTNCVKTSIKTWDKKDKSWRQHDDSDKCAAVFIISFVSTVLLSLRHVADIVSWLLHVLTHAGVRSTLEELLDACVWACLCIPV